MSGVDRPPLDHSGGFEVAEPVGEQSFRAHFDLRLRGGGRTVMVFDDGSLTLHPGGVLTSTPPSPPTRSLSCWCS
jgi:hypothetical protein